MLASARQCVAALACVVTLSGCGGIEPERRNPTPVEPASVSAVRRIVSDIERDRQAQVAVAWAPTGRSGAVRAVGTVPDVESWSTLKVPIAMAAARAEGGTPSAQTAALMRAAITVSDNAAAASLWHRLGDDAAAGPAVDAILRSGGDTATRAGQARGGAVSFGLTRWDVADSASFASSLPCVADPLTMRLLGEIQPAHRWGLGRLPGARFKGGWGPSPGGYLVRQIGVLPRPDGSTVGVALAVRPAGGDYAEGTRVLDAVAPRLAAALAADGGGRCGA